MVEHSGVFHPWWPNRLGKGMCCRPVHSALLPPHSNFERHSLAILYTKPNCPACTTIKSALNRNGIPFETVDVIEDDEAMAMVVQAGAKSMPVLFDDGRFFFSLEAMRAWMKGYGK